MMEWKELNITEMCDTISVSYKGDANEVVLINTSDVLEGACLNHERVPNKNLKGQFKKTFQKDDILYSEIRPANKRFAYIDFDPKDYIASTKLMVLRAKTNVNPRFLYQILRSENTLIQLQTLAESRSGTFPQITYSELANVSYPLPPKEHQDKIVSILSSLDRKIELNNKINAQLEEMAQAIFKSWFVDFEPFKDGKFVESEMGMIPEGWRVGTIGELIEVKYGKDHKKLDDGNIPVYGSGGVMRYAEKAIYQGESVLIPRKGTLNNVIYVDEDFWTVDTMFYSMPKKDNIMLMVYLMLCKKDLASMNAGSAVPSMTTDILNRMSIIIAEDSVLAKFNAVVKCMFDSINANKQESLHLSQLRDTLLPKLMNGEIEL